MTDRARENLLLFPKTLEYYQIQLTKLLESERYGEAKALLSFLLQCGGEAERHHAEWQVLLNWLDKAFPEERFAGDVVAALGAEAFAEAEPESEEELARRLTKERADRSESYVPNLLASLRQTDDPDKQKLIISQLTLIQHPDIEPALREWLASGERHPSVQFIALQALRSQGASGLTVMWRNGEAVTPEIEATPASFADFPPAIHRVIERVRLAAEVSDPALPYFAEEMWKECVQAAYGTPVYETMAAEDEAWTDIWAASLHRIVLESLHGEAADEAIRETYGVTDALRFRYEQALRWFRQYVTRRGPAR